MKNNIVGLKELRTDTENYINKVKRGESFIIVRRSKPVFKIGPLSEEQENWETVVDFTKIKKGGVPISDVLANL